MDVKAPLLSTDVEANFVFADLHDNDFGSSLVEALEYIWTNKEEDLTPDDFRFFMIEYMVFAEAVRRIHPGLKRAAGEAESTRAYLEDNLRITFETAKPDVDHDHGSAVLDTRSKQAWHT